LNGGCGFGKVIEKSVGINNVELLFKLDYGLVEVENHGLALRVSRLKNYSVRFSRIRCEHIASAIKKETSVVADACSKFKNRLPLDWNR